jgi:hypothetical protein
LYCITRRRTDQITQRGRGLKTEMYRFSRRLGTCAFHAWKVPRRWGQGRKGGLLRQKRYSTVQGPPPWGEKPKGAIMEDIHQTWLWPMSWAGLCDRSAAASWAPGLWRLGSGSVVSDESSDHCTDGSHGLRRKGVREGFDVGRGQ